MMTSYLNHLNKLQPTHPAYMFQPPHPDMDVVNGDLTKLVENVDSVHTFCERGGIVNPKCDTIARLKPVNDVVVHCSIVRLNHETQTIFDEPKSKPVKDNGGSGSAQDEEQPQAQGAGSKCLLTVSDLEYIGLATSYLRQTRIQDQVYTVLGQPINLPICSKVKRSIRQVTFWDETTTYRVNELLMTVLNMAFEMSQFPDLVDILHGMHALQTVEH